MARRNNGKIRGGLFPALLKHWRGKRGLSQLDLSLNADVSSRHISFLETGRAQPSTEMVLLLGSVLDVPLRDQNGMLEAAGLERHFDEPSADTLLSGPLLEAVQHMLASHEPYPMVVMNGCYDVLRMNSSGTRMLGRLLHEPAAAVRLNMLEVVFDPRLARPYILNWERLAKALLTRLHREVLHRRGDDGLRQLLQRLLDYPEVPTAWRKPDLSTPTDAMFQFRMRRDDIELAFLTTMTVFSAPQNVTLQELHIESYFPLDDVTRTHCRALTDTP